MFNWLDQFEARAQRVCGIERADSRDRGPSTGNRGGNSSGGRSGSTGGGSQSARQQLDRLTKSIVERAKVVGPAANTPSGGIGSRGEYEKMDQNVQNNVPTKQTYNWSVTPNPVPGSTPYHADPYASEIAKAVYDGLGIMGGGVGMVGSLADMLGGQMGVPSIGGSLFGNNTSPVNGYSSYDHPSNTGQAHGDPSQIYRADNGVMYSLGADNAPAIDNSSLTLDNLYAAINQALSGNDLYYLQQRGLAPMDATSVPDQWSPVFQREFDRIKSTVPTSAYSTATDGKFGSVTDYNKALDAISALFPTTFGNQALDAEQQRRQNEFKAGVGGLGLENQITSAFGDTADDSILQSIYDSQYAPAAQQLMNAYKRGALNPSGYSYAMNKLGEQGKTGMAKLQESGAAERAKYSTSLNDYLQTIYNKAGGWQLGQADFDPSLYTGEFNNQLNTAKGSLEGALSGNVPNIFDPTQVLQGAGSVQGMTNRGGLLDTLASRNFSNRRNTSRGIGSTGAF